MLAVRPFFEEDFVEMKKAIQTRFAAIGFVLAILIMFCSSQANTQPQAGGAIVAIDEAGLVALIVYNCNNLMNFNGEEATDWSLNLALGGKWDGVVKGLKNYKFFETIARVGSKLAKAPPSDIDNLRNSMSYLYTAYDIASMGGAKKLVSIDVPFAGIGAEVSFHYLDGEITIGDLIENTGEQAKSLPSGNKRIGEL